MWSGTMTQYCDGPTVPRGATTCNPGSTPHVRYPSAGAFAGVWFDTAAPSPSQASIAQLAQERPGIAKTTRSVRGIIHDEHNRKICRFASA